MFITLDNGRKFVIKFHYSTQCKAKFTKDQYGRTVNTFWDEHDTKTSIYEWFDDKPGARVAFDGFAHCSYKDKYDRKYGRNLSLVRALMEMKFHKQINKTEFWEIAEKAGLEKRKGAEIILGFCRAVNVLKDEE